jgi:ATP-dependent DNA helicase RecG
MAAFQKSPAERLATPVKFLKGVGPPREALFAKLGLLTVRDVLFYFPRDYEDLTQLRTIAELEDGRMASVRGHVVEVDQRTSEGGRIVTGVLLNQGNDHLRAVWFNQPYMTQKFRHGQCVLLSGVAKQWGLMWEMTHPAVQWLDEAADEPAKGKLLPVYPLCEGLKQRHVRRAVESAVAEYVSDLDEVFPAEFLGQHKLLPLRQALPQLHFPENTEQLEQARRRFVYQELFLLQLGLALRRARQRRGRSPVLNATAQIDARIRRLFPFELTAGQNQVIAEIAADLSREAPMNRLLQGDVGSGKTVVAAYGMLLAVAYQYQAALMAPTEVLARQHFETLQRLLAGSQVRLLLLTGGLTGKERERTLTAIAAGEFDLIVGTHALIQDDVQFHRLGLVVIDEQHKFGVRQRASLKGAGLQPHYLVMTATPIPRTVTMTQYGDLDVSLLRDSPPGRQSVHTYLADETQRAKWWDFFRRKLREGRQGYVITPRVEERVRESFLRGEEVDDGDMAAREEKTPDPISQTTSVEERFEALANGELEEFRIGLMHGRLSAEQKEATMAAFRRGELQVLVCTTVVEVGLDVPAATVMTIENGERFGLSQLHQLRGRISRGSHTGYCTVFAKPATEEARQRLEAFVGTTDGFRLAEIDFEQRGPGDLLGTRQHGLPPLRMADLVRDGAIVEEARRDATAMVEADPGLVRSEHSVLRLRVLARYGKALDLGDVG